MARHTRKKMFVDPKVQGALLFRVVIYWGYCLITVWALLAVWQVVSGPAIALNAKLNATWSYCGPAFLATLFVLPIVLFDLAKISNRFAGPLVRLRRDLRRLAHGEPVQAVHFRRGDFWHEMAEEFNAVASRIAQLEAELAAAGSKSPLSPREPVGTERG